MKKLFLATICMLSAEVVHADSSFNDIFYEMFAGNDFDNLDMQADYDVCLARNWKHEAEQELATSFVSDIKATVQDVDTPNELSRSPVFDPDVHDASWVKIKNYLDTRGRTAMYYMFLPNLGVQGIGANERHEFVENISDMSGFFYCVLRQSDGSTEHTFLGGTLGLSESDANVLIPLLAFYKIAIHPDNFSPEIIKAQNDIAATEQALSSMNVDLKNDDSIIAQLNVVSESTDTTREIPTMVMAVTSDSYLFIGAGADTLKEKFVSAYYYPQTNGSVSAGIKSFWRDTLGFGGLSSNLLQSESNLLLVLPKSSFVDDDGISHPETLRSGTLEIDLGGEKILTQIP